MDAAAARGAQPGEESLSTLTKIVCAVDFSEASEPAARYAAGLAAQTGAELHFVHAFQLPMLALPDGAVLPSPEWTSGASTRLQAALDDVAKRFAEVSVETHLREGMPHTQIAALVEDLDADLVVVGTHGRTGLTHLLLGSVASRIVRTSTVPVVTVPSRGDD
jgi:nucleotide-binding universal stress UspA family protein